MSDFISYVKSTIDKSGVTIAEGFGGDTKFVDLDDTVNAAEVMAGAEAAIVWTMLSLEESPIAPLYTLNFGIGAKTTLDPGNYAMTDLLDAVGAVMKKGATIPIRDYSVGGDGTTSQGTMTVTDISVDPQLFDKQSGLRLLSVTAMVVDDG
jgi:hypothetical protein